MNCVCPGSIETKASYEHMKKINLSIEEGRKLAREMKAVFLETSAKENQNVADIFTSAITEMEKDGFADNSHHSGGSSLKETCAIS